MTTGPKIAIGAAALILALVLLTKEAGAKPLPAPPPQPPPPPPPAIPEPPKPVAVGDKMSVTTQEVPFMKAPGGKADFVSPKQPNLPKGIVVKIIAIGFKMPGQGEDDWSQVVIHAPTAWVLFDKEENVVGFIPTRALEKPESWTPATF
jgi:hypothetical protein